MDVLSTEQLVMRRQPEYPADRSMGGDNAYSIGCVPLEFRTGYCVCLHKINAKKRDGHLKSYPDCEKAIGVGTCTALELKAQEETAGKALFFLDRKEFRAEMDKQREEANAQPSIGKWQPKKPNYGKVTAPPEIPTAISEKPEPKAVESGNGYAAAINKALQSIPPEKPVAPPSGRPSLLDLARKQLNP